MIMDNVITIAIPVYNVEKYIEKSLLSALNQDFAFPYEILIIDDCGSDKSMQIVNRILNEHERGRYARIIRHSTNLGLGPARNTAIENASGKYLFFWIVMTGYQKIVYLFSMLRQKRQKVILL